MIALVLLACGGPDPEPGDDVDPDSLAALGLLEWDGATFTYAEGVAPYTLATPLFSDFSVKERAIALPGGEPATYAGDVLDFPVGTRLVKSFLFPADLREPTVDLRLIETRILTREEDGWDAWPYLWNADGTEAVKAPSGDVVDVTVVDHDGREITFAYLVPQRNQCVDCHERSVDGERENVPLGPTPRNLHVGDQLASLAAAGVVDGLPPLDEIVAATDERAVRGVDPATLPDEVLLPAARDYLDVNCAHCHHPDAEEGRSSQLFLDWDAQDPFHYGVCKKPGSAGRGTGGLTYDVVPGRPEDSILWYRMQTDVVGEMMPDIGRALVDVEGVALVAEWIRRMVGECSER